MESTEQKMKAYLDMYKKPLSHQVIMALSTLAGIPGKSKLDLIRCFPHDNVRSKNFNAEVEARLGLDEIRWTS